MSKSKGFTLEFSLTNSKLCFKKIKNFIKNFTSFEFLKDVFSNFTIESIFYFINNWNHKIHHKKMVSFLLFMKYSLTNSTFKCLLCFWRARRGVWICWKQTWNIYGWKIMFMKVTSHLNATYVMLSFWLCQRKFLPLSVPSSFIHVQYRISNSAII